MSTDGLEIPSEELSLEELMQALESSQTSIQQVRESETLRQRVRHLIVKRAIVEHREIYERLTEV